MMSMSIYKQPSTQSLNRKLGVKRKDDSNSKQDQEVEKKLRIQVLEARSKRIS
jgi:hypothetical protein